MRAYRCSPHENERPYWKTNQRASRLPCWAWLLVDLTEKTKSAQQSIFTHPARTRHHQWLTCKESRTKRLCFHAYETQTYMQHTCRLHTARLLHVAVLLPCMWCINCCSFCAECASVSHAWLTLPPQFVFRERKKSGKTEKSVWEKSREQQKHEVCFMS